MLKKSVYRPLSEKKNYYHQMSIMSSTHHQNRKNVELISGKVVMEEVPGFPIGQPEFIPAKKIAKQVMALMHVSVFYCMYKLI